MLTADRFRSNNVCPFFRQPESRLRPFAPAPTPSESGVVLVPFSHLTGVLNPYRGIPV